MVLEERRKKNGGDVRSAISAVFRGVCVKPAAAKGPFSPCALHSCNQPVFKWTPSKPIVFFQFGSTPFTGHSVGDVSTTSLETARSDDVSPIFWWHPGLHESRHTTSKWSHGSPTGIAPRRCTGNVIHSLHNFSKFIISTDGQPKIDVGSTVVCNRRIGIVYIRSLLHQNTICFLLSLNAIIHSLRRLTTRLQRKYRMPVCQHWLLYLISNRYSIFR